MAIIDKQFLEAIHGKIKRKKRHFSMMFTLSLILIIIFLSHEASKIIQIELYDLQWTEYQYDQEEYYFWEVNNTLSNDELLFEMLYLFNMDEILDVLDNSSELIQIVKAINMEGKS